MRHALAFIVLALFIAPTAQAWRCGTDLVLRGDKPYEVLRSCGEPDYIEYHPEVFLRGFGFVGEIEKWYYNRGPRRFVRILRFRNGELTRIETGGYGFSEPSAGDCSPRQIKRGMSKFELLHRCGKPDYERSRWELVQPGLPALVDDWVYDFGPARFAREVRIIDGRVVDVDLGEH